MNDREKTKEQLIEELTGLRQRLAELETCDLQLDLVRQNLCRHQDGPHPRDGGLDPMLELLDRNPSPIMLLDSQGGCTHGNPAALQLMECTRDEMAGKDIGDLVAPHEQRDVLTEYRRMWDTGGTLETECHVSGMRRVVELTMTPIVWHEERVMLSLGRDITEPGLAETRLKQTMAELEQLTYMASHDLREPLRTVTSYVELLARRYKDKLDVDANDFIGFAVDGANRMQHLIDDLLAYSRVGTRGKPFQPVDCEAALAHATANLRMAIDDCHASVTHDPLPTVIADATQMVSLFQNLLDNAVKFRRRHTPHVHVSCQQDQVEWLFSVSDNGIGIDPGDVERIFIISQRLHTRAEYPGTGLGLAICKKIMVRHGGRMWVESEPGKGSRFCFTIPKPGGEQP